MISKFTNESISLLKNIIAIPSISKEEKEVADFLENTLHSMDLNPNRLLNNVWITAPNYQENRPTLLLNSHIDTVKPVANWSIDPFKPTEEGDKIIGLGSNDAGASLVALLAAFRYLAQKEQNYNLIFAATAEEEISGKNGVAALLPTLGTIDLGVVGEPTQMQMAVAEKGLMVIDATVEGLAGHAARNEGVNAIYEALPIITFFQNLKLEKSSPFLGDVKISVTGIQAGSQHNVVPDKCTFVMDVRVNECYNNEELFNYLQSKVNCKLKARSYRLNSSSIAQNHPIVKKGLKLGLTTFGSPTLSDQALMNFTTIKIGPGNSARSHTANEFIYQQEIKKGVEKYIQLLDGLNLNQQA